MHAYKEIERRLRSFNDRSNLMIQFKNELFNFTKLNSPYISHQKCEIVGGHKFDRVIIFGSVKEEREGVLFIHAEKEAISGDVISRQIPAHLLPGLIFPASYPAWAKNGQVWVSYPDTFSGYDDDGKPSFEKYSYVKIYDKEVLTPRSYSLQGM